jgi:hypothetical protein
MASCSKARTTRRRRDLGLRSISGDLDCDRLITSSVMTREAGVAYVRHYGCVNHGWFGPRSAHCQNGTRGVLAPLVLRRDVRPRLAVSDFGVSHWRPVTARGRERF